MGVASQKNKPTPQKHYQCWNVCSDKTAFYMKSTGAKWPFERGLRPCEDASAKLSFCGQKWARLGPLSLTPRSPKSLRASLCGNLSQEMRHMKYGARGPSVCFICLELRQGSFPCSRPFDLDTKKEGILESHYVLAKQIKLFPKLDLQHLQMVI